MTAIDISTAPIAAALRDAGFTGRIVEPGDSGYEPCAPGWNGTIDRPPAGVAFAADAADVAAAILAARAVRLPFTIRAGGQPNAAVPSRPIWVMLPRRLGGLTATLAQSSAPSEARRSSENQPAPAPLHRGNGSSPAWVRRFCAAPWRRAQEGLAKQIAKPGGWA